MKRHATLLLTLVFGLGIDLLSAQGSNEYVHVRGTPFALKDLEDLCKNPELKKLDLRGAGMSDRSMVYLSKLGALEELRLDSHTITTKGYTVLESLKKLRVLGVQSATSKELTKIFEIVKDLPLEELDVSNSRDFTGRGLEILNCKQTLKKLDISCGRGTADDRGIESLKDFTSLTHLDLNGHSKIKKGVKFLEGMTQLEELNIYECVGMEDKDLNSLYAKLTKLKYLNAGFCWWHEGVGLTFPPSLENLYLVESKRLTDEAFTTLPCKDKLVHVNLVQCLPLTDKGVAAFSDMKQLRSFNIGCIRALTNESLKSISGNTGLTNLNISDNDHFDDEGLANLRDMHQMEILNLWHIKGIKGSGLKHLAGMTRLLELNLADCHNLQSQHFSHIKSLPSLQNLYLDNCISLDDDALAKLAGKLELEELTIRGCEKLTEKSLTHIKTLASLKYLDISNCVAFSDQAVRMIRKALPRCEVVR